MYLELNDICSTKWTLGYVADRSCLINVHLKYFQLDNGLFAFLYNEWGDPLPIDPLSSVLYMHEVGMCATKSKTTPISLGDYYVKFCLFRFACVCIVS